MKIDQNPPKIVIWIFQIDENFWQNIKKSEIFLYNFFVCGLKNTFPGSIWCGFSGDTINLSILDVSLSKISTILL